LLRSSRAREAAEVARRARVRALAPLFRTIRRGRLAPEQRARFERAVADYHAARDELDALFASRWRSSKKTAPAWAGRHRVQRRTAERALEEALSVFGSEPPAKEHRPRGELTLAYYPLAHGWAGFAELDGAVTARVFAAERPDSALLAPFADELARASRV